MQIKIHDIIEMTKANGPGTRFAIYFQGCKFGCKHCINPQTHDLEKGTITTTEKVLNQIERIHNHIEGITFTGGEPLLQKEAVITIAEKVKSWNLTTLLSTGFEFEELCLDPSFFSTLKNNCDVIIAGRYHHEERIGTGMLGSSNKRILLNSKIYTIDDIVTPFKMEIGFTKNGIRAAGTGIHSIFDWSTF